jgi:AcrR family transcriptional regulator
MALGDRSPRTDHATRTRQAIVDSALRLCAKQGFDNTTTDEIAELADISPRTFFRYFPTKESVFLFGEYDFVRSFAALCRAQPDSISDLDAIRTTFVTLAPGIERLRGRIGLYRKAVESSPTLRGRERSNHEENAATLAAAIAERRSLLAPDADCDLLAAVGMLVMERALATWLSGPARLSLGGVLEAEFRRLQELLGEHHTHARS